MSRDISQSLRERAERYVQQLNRTRDLPGAADLSQLLHELSVHQVELELQADELKRTSEQLTEARSLYFQHFQAAPLPIFRITTDGTILETNLAGTELLGLAINEWRRHSVNLINRGFLARHRPSAQNFLRTAIQSQSPTLHELCCQPNGQEDRWVEVCAQPVEATQAGNARNQLILYFQDITHRKQTQDAMERQWRTLEQVMESEISGYWDWELDKNILTLSAGWKRMLGYEDHEIPNVPDSYLALMLPEDHEPSAKALQSYFSSFGAKLFYNEVRYRHKDGHIVWVICSGRVVHWSHDQKPQRMIGMHIDITRIKNSEARLAQAMEEARELARDAQAANEAKNSFLANMSHEIRTPMNGVLGMLEVLRLTPLNPQQIDYTDIIRNSAKALLDLMNDLLDLARLSSGRSDLRVAIFDLHELLTTITATTVCRAEKRGLTFSLDLHPELPAKVRGDRGRLGQILGNLLNNALKFTETGTVTLTAHEPVYDGNDVILTFTVCDTGIGIAPDQLERIFDTFVQVDEAYNRKFGGTGLGLTICKQLVALMNGHFFVASSAGQGSEFKFDVRLEKG